MVISCLETYHWLRRHRPARHSRHVLCMHFNHLVDLCCIEGHPLVAPFAREWSQFKARDADSSCAERQKGELNPEDVGIIMAVERRGRYRAPRVSRSCELARPAFGVLVRQ